MTQRFRLRAGLTSALVAGFITAYFGASTLVDLSATHTLATRFDDWIPFVPAAVFMYAWVYPGAFLPLFTVRSDAVFVRVGVAYAIVLGVALALYLAFPVGAMALRAEVDGLDRARFADWGVALVYRLDPPINLFPSIHVAFATVAAIAARRVWPRYALAAIPWALAVALSTCLTKQHYVLDVLAGALLGAGAYRLAMWSAAPEPDRPLHYGWLGPLLQLALYAALLCAAYAVFIAA